jgi:mono/diheme cytochrome c family protein
MKVGLWALLLIFLTSCGSNKSPSSENDPLQPTSNLEGKEIFTTKCASCHRVNVELAGPALKGVEARWPDREKLYAFIRNSEKVIQTDKYAHDLWLKFNQTAMTKHLDMTDTQIESVLDYINSVSGQ